MCMIILIFGWGLDVCIKLSLEANDIACLLVAYSTAAINAENLILGLPLWKYFFLCVCVCVCVCVRVRICVHMCRPLC